MNSTKKAETTGRNIFTMGVLLMVLVGLPLGLAGLVVGIFLKWHILMWVGLIAIGIGFLFWVLGMIIGAGVATKDAQDAFDRYQQSQKDKV